MERKKTKAGRLCVVSQFDRPGHLGVFASLAALPLLLALGRGALARLHLVHDEARVALFAVPLEALEVGV